MRWFLYLAAIWGLALSGCATTGSTSGAAAGRVSSKRNLELLQKSGDHAAVTLLIEPRRFPELRTSLQLSGLLPSQDFPAADAVLSAPDFWSAIGALVAATSESGKAAPWPAALAGWDDSRPVVFALFDAPPIDLGELALALLDSKRPQPGPRLIHHRVLLPARNPAVLARALAAALHAAGLRSDAHGVFGGRGLQLRVLPDKGYVRVEAVLASDGLTPDLDRELQAPPRVSPALVMTPALHFALRSSQPLRVYVRPGVFRELNLARAAEFMAAAVSGADPEMRAVVALKGWSETAGGELIFNASDAEVIDAAFAVSGEPGGVRSTSILSLSEPGQALLQLGVQKAHCFEPAAGVVALGHLSLALNLAVMADRAAQPWTRLATADGQNPASLLRGLVERVRECGGLCTAYLGIRHPLSVARLLAEQEDRVRRNLPGGIDMTLLDMPDSKPRGALVATLPSSISLKAALFALGLSMGLESDWGTTLPDGAQPLRLGLGVDPTTIYAGEVSACKDQASLARGSALTLLDLDLKPEPLLPLLRGLGGLGRLLQTFGRWRVRAQLWPASGALVAQSVATKADEGTAAALGLAAELLPGERTWQSAQAAVASPGTACLNRIVEQLARAAGAVAGLDPEMKLTVLKAANSEIIQDQACAEHDPRTRVAAENLRKAWALAIASFRAAPR